MTEEIIEVLRLMFQERIRSRTKEEIMDILVPQGSGTDWRSGHRRSVSLGIGGKDILVPQIMEVIALIQEQIV